MPSMKSVTRWVLASGMAGAMLGGLAACEGPKVQAPDEHNTCYHIGYPKTGGIKVGDFPAMKFNPVKTNVTSIEQCAAELEILRMTMAREGVPHATIDGAYNGNFLFIEGRFVKMATEYDSHRITLLVKTDDGRLVVPGAVAVEDDPAPSAPVSEPKNLPH